MSDSDNDIANDLNRARHNARERVRRDRIKENLNNLRDAIPGLKGQKISTTQICVKATEYLEKAVKQNAETERKCVELRRDNEMLKNKFHELAEEKGLDPEAAVAADLGTLSYDAEEK